MKIALNIINIFILFALLYLLMDNSMRVTVRFFTVILENVPLNTVILASAAFGALFGVIFTSVSLIKQKSENRAIRKQNRQLKQELDSLRNISIEEIPEEIIEEPKQLNGGEEQ